MNDVSHEEIRIKWRNLIGDFMMEFGEIEYISYSLWSKQYKHKEPIHGFTKRTRQLISQLNNKKNKEVIRLLEDAINLAVYRNIIAHNPMLLMIFKQNAINVAYPEFSISAYMKDNCIHIDKLEELTAKATNIKTQLCMILGYLPQEDKNG